MMNRIVLPEPTSKHIGTATELTCLMPIRQGFVPVLDTRTYATRVRIVFKVLQNLRTISREVRHLKPILDIVDAARTVQSFSWSIVNDRQLLLSVSFDRPWEPYIRVIWKDLGPLLDLFLCNVEGFVPSAEGHERFAAFVRRHQIEASFYYPASSLTVDDQKYLAQLEKAHRDDGDNFDERATTMVAKGPLAFATEDGKQDPAQARAQWLTALEALYGLRNLYPEGSEDHEYLHRAAQTLLASSRPQLDLGQTAALKWLNQPEAAPRPTPDRELDRSTIQGGILEPYRGVTHGCLLLATIENPASARRFIGQLASGTDTGWRIARGDDAKGANLRLNVAFSAGGLRQLGVRESDVLRFPKEFREGMEARAGFLGDVRDNHPERWTLPSWNVRITPAPSTTSAASANTVHFLEESASEASNLPPIRMSTVDVVFTLSLTDAWTAPCDLWTAEHPLYSAVTRLCSHASESGIRVQSLQRMQRLKPPPGSNTQHQGSEKYPTVDHFGFVDGISQPVAPSGPNPKGRNEVALGELLVGFQNERRDPPFPERSDDPLEWTRGSLLDGGSFLVVRKLRQHVKALQDIQHRSAMREPGQIDPNRLLEKMVGRTREGAPLVKGGAPKGANDFDFSADPKGEACPFHAHIRRANPRLARPESGVIQPPVPRIARRGLAYGPPFDGTDRTDRGIVFMAYNASIAEQFETVQRWMSGGNTPAARGDIGVYGGQPDPLLGLPDADGKRTFRFMEGSDAVRVDLGDKPFVTLQWGLYLFAPSIAALKSMAEDPGPPGRDLPVGEAVLSQGRRIIQSLVTPLDWTAVLEDITLNQSGATAAVFTAIRAFHGGVLRTPYGVIVASRTLIRDVLQSDPDFSVQEYQRRFAASVGESYLGLDRGAEYNTLSAVPNRALESVTEVQAFEHAYGLTRSTMARMIASSPEPRASVSLEAIVGIVLANLAREWFDIPDGTLIGLPNPAQPPSGAAVQCPFHLLAPSRYVFSSPNPRKTVRDLGEGHGQQLLEATRAFVKARRAQAQTSGDLGLKGPISKALFQEMPPDDDLVARTLLGLVFGFVPTVFGNALQVFGLWLGDESLWRVQQRLLAAGTTTFDVATRVLRPHIERAMQTRPVPALLHRTATVDRLLGGVQVSQGDRIVLAISAATRETLGEGRSDVTMVFGGDRRSEAHPTHACPGAHIAMGVLVGLIGAVLETTPLHPAPTPLTVMATRPRPS